MIRRAAVAALFLAGVLLAAPFPPGATAAPDGIAVGSKNFPESRLLAEMFARIIEDRTDLRVERRLNLAGTKVCLDALRGGHIDLYPEYTGTGLVAILNEEPEGGAAETLARVRDEFRRRWDLRWLAPLGFENAYELAVPRALAERESLRTISDLVRVAPRLTAGLGYEFVQRPDGLPGLKRVYGLEFGDVKEMQQALKYQAAGAGRLDVLDVYTTDGRLLVYDLVVLEDDRSFFPPYEAAPLVRGEVIDRHPEVAAALTELSGLLDEDLMRSLNLRLQEKGETAAGVAQDALEDLGLVGEREVAAVSAEGRSLPGYMWANRAELLRRAGEHVVLAAMALVLGVALAVPLGLALERRRGAAEGVIRVVGLTQTIPSIALLAFMIPLFGVGTLPAVIALWIYSLFPILRNTFSGVRDADPRATEAAAALGMTERQVLRQVRLPLAAPVIMAGVRTAAVITVGTATLAAFIGAGGLGAPIVAGLQLADTVIILSGAIPAAALAFLVDALLGRVEHALKPRGLEIQS
jgi:osmoprotectant transport system permease protein